MSVLIGYAIEDMHASPMQGAGCDCGLGLEVMDGDAVLTSAPEV